MRNVYRNFVGKPEDKRLLWRTFPRRENNIKINLKDIRRLGVDWIRPA